MYKSRPGQNKGEDYRARKDREEHDRVKWELSGAESGTGHGRKVHSRVEKNRAAHTNRTGELYSGATAAAINSTAISKQ